MTTVKSAIYGILTGDAGITAIVNLGIYPSCAPSSAGAPYIVYSIISDSPANTISASTGLNQYRIQFSCFASDSATNSALMGALKSCLDVKVFNSTGYQLSASEDSSIDSTETPLDASEDWSFVDNIDYMVWFRSL